MAAMSNWIDSLWANSHDQDAEGHLRKLWLRFQADRKQAWDELRALVACSERLRQVGRQQILVALPVTDQQKVEELVLQALDEAEKTLSEERWRLPAGTPGVFLPYLRAKNRSGRYHWVQRVLTRYFRDQAMPGEREQQLQEGEEE